VLRVVGCSGSGDAVVSATLPAPSSAGIDVRFQVRYVEGAEAPIRVSYRTPEGVLEQPNVTTPWESQTPTTRFAWVVGEGPRQQAASRFVHSRIEWTNWRGKHRFRWAKANVSASGCGLCRKRHSLSTAAVYSFDARAGHSNARRLFAQSQHGQAF
jgi:hypothetical protein